MTIFLFENVFTNYENIFINISLDLFFKKLLNKGPHRRSEAKMMLKEENKLCMN